jgi:eukaryotic-like serine/threonine-protein kinase
LRTRLAALLAAHERPDTALEAVTVEARPTMKLDLAEPSDEAVGQTIGPLDGLGAGRYKLLERIGEGGRGVVYVAGQTEPVRRRVALKVIKLGLDTVSVHQGSFARRPTRSATRRPVLRAVPRPSSSPLMSSFVERRVPPWNAGGRPPTGIIPKHSMAV